MLREFWNNPFSLGTARATARGMGTLARHLLVLLPGGAGILFRRNLGPRHLPTMFLGLLAFSLIAALDATGLGALLFLYMLVRALKHAWAAIFRTPQDGPRHSRYEGDSLPVWQRLGLSQDAAQRFGEPLGSVLLGLLLLPIVPVVGVWFAGAGIAQAVKEFLNRARANRRILDTLDNRIESQQMSTAMNRYLHVASDDAQRFHTARLAHRPTRIPNRRR
jgi:hypothetical protein